MLFKNVIFYSKFYFHNFIFAVHLDIRYFVNINRVIQFFGKATCLSNILNSFTWSLPLPDLSNIVFFYNLVYCLQVCIGIYFKYNVLSVLRYILDSSFKNKNTKIASFTEASRISNPWLRYLKICWYFLLICLSRFKRAASRLSPRDRKSVV